MLESTPETSTLPQHSLFSREMHLWQGYKSLPMKRRIHTYQIEAEAHPSVPKIALPIETNIRLCFILRI
ncbi:MAG: hypothetical protein P4L96_01300 [Rhodoferax sp.]|nr:hypothetical protein [Rhodoferax sp.]